MRSSPHFLHPQILTFSRASLDAGCFSGTAQGSAMADSAPTQASSPEGVATATNADAATAEELEAFKAAEASADKTCLYIKRCGYGNMVFYEGENATGNPVYFVEVARKLVCRPPEASDAKFLHVLTCDHTCSGKGLGGCQSAVQGLLKTASSAPLYSCRLQSQRYINLLLQHKVPCRQSNYKCTAGGLGCHSSARRRQARQANPASQESCALSVSPGMGQRQQSPHQGSMLRHQIQHGHKHYIEAIRK